MALVGNLSRKLKPYVVKWIICLMNLSAVNGSRQRAGKTIELQDTEDNLMLRAEIPGVTKTSD